MVSCRSGALYECIEEADRTMETETKLGPHFARKLCKERRFVTRESERVLFH